MTDLLHLPRRELVDRRNSADLETLKHIDRIKDYGEYSFFPVFSGK